MRRSARSALLVWGGLSLLIAATSLLIYLKMGYTGFDHFVQQPPLINLPVTLWSVALVWISAGVLLVLLEAGSITGRNVLTLGGFFLVCWSYLNILSERWRYGDYTYYFESAATMYRNEPLHGSYFYPPLWATLTQFLVPLGEDKFFMVLWLLDIVSFVAFFFLLHRALQRYGFSQKLAALVTTAFMLACAPLLRTMVYVQVNLHTLNLILLSVLWYPKRSFLSALMLALAIHLKGSPAVLVLAFLLEKDWRWVAWLGICLVIVAGITVITDGISPFLDVIQHWQGLALSENTIYHDTSIDSFLRSTSQFVLMGTTWTRILIYLGKAALAGGCLWVIVRCVRAAQFVKGDLPGARLLNALPPLFILMTLSAPVVWEHHGVFMALPYLLMLKRLETPHEWLWFGFAYMLEFLLPTFDFYPWSFGRLFAPVLILWQMWRLAGRKGDAHPFTALNRWFDKLPTLRVAA